MRFHYKPRRARVVFDYDSSKPGRGLLPRLQVALIRNEFKIHNMEPIMVCEYVTHLTQWAMPRKHGYGMGPRDFTCIFSQQSY